VLSFHTKHKYFVPWAWYFIPSGQVFIPQTTNFILISFSTHLIARLIVHIHLQLKELVMFADASYDQIMLLSLHPTPQDGCHRHRLHPHDRWLFDQASDALIRKKTAICSIPKKVWNRPIKVWKTTVFQGNSYFIPENAFYNFVETFHTLGIFFIPWGSFSTFLYLVFVLFSCLWLYKFKHPVPF
jgi:hypothetical protein